MEVKALFDKFQKNKKILKAKQAQQQSQKLADSNSSQKNETKKLKPPKTSKDLKQHVQRHESSSKCRKNTEEGFKIYTEDELRLGDGKVGATAECPFDCECCY